MKPHLTEESELKEESKPTLFMQWLLEILWVEPPFSGQALRTVLAYTFLAHAAESVALSQDTRCVYKPVQESGMSL